MTILNCDTFNMIMEFAGMKEYWKYRFTWDVLPEINKGYITVYISDGEICKWCYWDSLINNNLFSSCIYCHPNNPNNLGSPDKEFVSINFKDFAELVRYDKNNFLKIISSMNYSNAFNILKNSRHYFSHYKTQLGYEIIYGVYKQLYSSQKYTKLKKIMKYTKNTKSEVWKLDT